MPKTWRRHRGTSAAVGLWLVSALTLSQVTGRVTDWFVMTDELVYERLAISIARSGSPLPRIHGASVTSLDQLYPLLIAPLFRDGAVTTDLHRAHILGAWLMTSACIPAFLLARRVTARSWVAFAIAVGSIAIPWLIYSSFLLTETVAYPVFVWAMLALQRTVASPSVRGDLAVLATLALTFLARTELIALVAVAPPAIFLTELGAPSIERWPARARAAARRSVTGHRMLTVAYALLAVGGLVFLATGGRVASLSVYGEQIHSGVLPPGLTREVLGHFAQAAFTLGVLPFVAGLAWLLANSFAPSRASLDARSFAAVGSVTVVAVTVEVARYDAGLGTLTLDRYLFYLVPVVLLGFACAVLDRRWPRWSLLLPLALVCAGFALRLQPAFTWTGRIDPDSPDSIFYHPLLEVLGSIRALQAGLVAAAIALTALFALAGLRVASRRALGPVLIVLSVCLLFTQTGYVFVRLFRTSGYSSRPLTAPIPPELEWLDATVGRGANVTIIPYHVSTDYFVTLRYWRDLEFWNKSVERDAEFPTTAPYSFTGIWFPKLTLGFDPTTGRAGISPTRYAVQSLNDSRFQLAGNVQNVTGPAELIDADMPWRASFLTFGTYDDGWLKPKQPAVIRVFPTPGETRPRIHTLSLQVWAPSDVVRRPFSVRSNEGVYRGVASNAGTTFVNALHVCVPASGYADVSVTAPTSSPIPGDLSSLQGSLGTRVGSVALADVSVSDNVGAVCVPRGATATS